MKVKTTRKEITRLSGKKVSIGYCGAQHLLWFRQPFAYTCGVYGWNFDAYDINGVIITTGYRGMVGEHVDYDVLKKYENEARAVLQDYKRPFEDRKADVEALLNQFIEEVYND